MTYFLLATLCTILINSKVVRVDPMEEWRMIYFAKAFECSFPVLESLHYSSPNYVRYSISDKGTANRLFAVTDMPLSYGSFLIVGKAATGKTSLCKALVETTQLLTVRYLQAWYNSSLSHELEELLQADIDNYVIVLDGVDYFRLTHNQRIMIQELFLRIRKFKCRLIVTAGDLHHWKHLSFDWYILSRCLSGDAGHLPHITNFPIKCPITNYNAVINLLLSLAPHEWFIVQNSSNDRKYSILKHNYQ